MLVDPELVQDYLNLPMMDRLLYMLNCSLSSIMRNATEGIPVYCSLTTQNEDGNIKVYCPNNGFENSCYLADQTADFDEKEEYIALEAWQTITQQAKQTEIDGNGEPLYPIRNIRLLTELDGKRIYWCPISHFDNIPCFRNELFLRLCDEFGERWGDFLSRNDINNLHEFWDVTSRRVIGVPNLFTEYTASLLLSDHFHLDDYENDGINLLTYLNILSSQPYEGRQCKGTICILKRNLQNISLLMKFSKETHILDRPIRENRKLLEMTDEKNALIVQEGLILGIGARELGDDIITFSGNADWSFESHDGITHFRSETGNIRITSKVDDSRIGARLSDEFREECDIPTISDIVMEASKQKHGTGIVISTDAKNEAERLEAAGRAIVIEPLFLGNHKESIVSMTKIDGALIIDPYGTCYAVGVIVDGIADVKGASSRGARYNSLMNYVAWQQDMKEKCLAVIISEDGTIDYSLPHSDKESCRLSNG